VVNMAMIKPLYAAATALVLGASSLAAQQVLGRAVRDTDGTPLGEALIILLDDRGQERARTITTPTGGFDLRAPGAGRYRLRILRIGQRGWETPPFDLALEQISRPRVRVPDRPFELEELTTWARRPNCGVTLGDASVGAALLEAAQTALGLAEAEVATGRRIYATESYRRTVPVVGPPEDSVAIQGKLAGWPIQSAPPDSLRQTGFVQGDWPPPSFMREGSQAGPIYFGPDARVLFTDWFLGTHCISVDTRTGRSSDERTRVVARFKPAKGTRNAAALNGWLEFDRTSLALRSLNFEFAARPRWAPKGSGGGEIRFARLPGGVWLPVQWSMRAPVPKVAGEGHRYQFFGIVETTGQVTAVRRPDGRPDREAEAAITAAE
jgi:Carboxypeptidase regulatory-like domain